MAQAQTQHDPSDDALERLDRAIASMVARQGEKGSWFLDYGGALFLTPMFVMSSHITGYQMSRDDKVGLTRYLLDQQNPDGGFGLHAEGPSTVFVTTLSYVALRLLGLEADDDGPRQARQWLRGEGGALAIPSWGKFMLCLLSLYRYEGINPILPELWLLPSWAPIQPGKLWCHCRVVYLPMSYLYGRKARTPVTPLIEALRDELYDGSWDEIDWSAQRNNVAAVDIHTPHSSVLDAVNLLQGRFERVAPAALRQRALAEVLDHIRHEDETTHFIDIGPVNKMLNTVSWHFAAPDGPELRQHFERLPDYLWRGPDGVKVQGYNSTELWDTAFALQAIADTPLADRYSEALLAGHRYVKENQVLEDVSERERYHRDPSAGGWPFSNLDHGWPIADCTAEGLEVALELADLAGDDRIPLDRLRKAVELILFFQNDDDGGWATYEKRRGSALLEWLNPSEVFGAIMVDYSYPECSAACIRALAKFRDHHPGVLSEEIDRALARGRDYLLDVQRDDGSWYGSWGVCFTYGTWFGVWGLRAAGLPTIHHAFGRACRFLLGKQRADGGWGEHFSSCHEHRYIEAEQSLVVNTAWALMALMRGGCRDREAIARGIAFLHERQLADGSWPKEAMAGVFNHTCMLNYDLYYQTFPIWALGLYQRYRREGEAPKS
jgi:squalene/oxidosqualene cyclase-like protein